jgi:hypothetical protein
VLIAVDPSGFASGFSGEPQIDIAREATIHMDTEPDPIVDGSGSALAAGGPVKNLYQSYSLALRLIARVAFAVRAPGLVQVVDGVTW